MKLQISEKIAVIKKVSKGFLYFFLCSFLLLISLIATSTETFGQNEQSPIQTKDFGYLDWTYKNVQGEGSTNLRKFVQGKKLVIVVYWAPWCHNWENDRDYVESLYQKYKSDGLAIIGVAEYDSLEKVRNHIKQFKVTFPVVYESEKLDEREKTVHFQQRRSAGDTRKWGSPWYVFIEPDKILVEGEVITKPTVVVNGELIREQAEKFVREKLGLEKQGGSGQNTGPNGQMKDSRNSNKIQPCMDTANNTGKP
jgi:glutathione peroxidase-family protein